MRALEALRAYRPDDDDAPGGLVAARRRDGTGWDALAFGTADVEAGTAMTLDRVWHAASLTKQLAAMALLRACAAACVPLDARVGDVLPDAFAGAPMRLRHLLFHASGLTDEAVTARTDDPAAVVAVAAALAREAAPGLRFHYANVNYTILAEVVARLDERVFPEALDALVLAPAGMTKAACDPARNGVVGHAPADGGWRADPRRTVVPGPEGVFLTLADWQAWHEALEAKAFGSALHAVFDAPGRLDDGAETPYGCGQFVFRKGDLRLLMHRSQDRNQSAFYLRGAEPGLGVLAVTNGRCPDLAERAWEIVRDYYA